jgi:PAS domain S-box-containing protein
MVIVTNEDGNITMFNPAAERALGYTAEECISKLTPTVFHDPDEIAERARIFSAELGIPITPDFEVFVTKARYNLYNEHDWTYIRKDGSRFPVLLSVTALRDLQENIMFHELLGNPAPNEIYVGNGLDPEDIVWKTYEIKSQLAIAIYPKVGSPWECGLHQCSHIRMWKPQEKKLFLEISRRLGDMLTSLLSYRDLKELNNQLEIRVEQRTNELSQANKQMRLEIIERQKAQAERDVVEVQLRQSQKLEAIETTTGWK